MDGLGLTMFLPLLKMVNDSESTPNLGKLSYVVDLLNFLGLDLTIISILILMLIFFISKGFLSYFGNLYKINVLQWFIKNIRFKHIKQLRQLDFRYFVTADVGRIQNTLTGEVSRVAQSYRNYFSAMQAMVLVIVYMGFAFYIDYQFAILVSIGGLITNFLFKKLYQKTKGTSRRLTGETSLFQGLIIQSIANFKYLKATGSLMKYSKKLKDSVNDIEKSNKLIGKLDAILNAAREPILVIVVVVVIIIQIKFLGSEMGPILMSLLFFYRALTYLMQMQVFYNKFLGVSGSLENTKLFETELRNNKERLGNSDITGTIEQLKLNGLKFHYGDKKVINEVNLSINKFETVAFVGESGSGKTTLVNILVGLLPVEKGFYSINNIDSREVNMSSFQNRIGYITQDPVIFNDTVFNNVTFWAEKSEQNLLRFKKALKQAAIFEYVDSLTEKEDAVLGNNGVNLSGGQRQRISIARELFKEVEILVLDEATSALDSETERSIQENIDKLSGKYTIFIVAHRISTIKNADRIVILNEGNIRAMGTFNNLIKESEYFKKLVEFQEI